VIIASAHMTADSSSVTIRCSSVIACPRRVGQVQFVENRPPYPRSMAPTRQSDRPTRQFSASRAYGAWKDEAYDALADIKVVGRISKRGLCFGRQSYVTITEALRELGVAIHGRCDGGLLLSRDRSSGRTVCTTVLISSVTSSRIDVSTTLMYGLQFGRHDQPASEHRESAAIACWMPSSAASHAA
jgi:hypothetical protein